MPWKGFTPESVEGLPTGIVKGLSLLSEKERKGDVSVTELCAPVQATVLKQRHDFYTDADEQLWAIFGKALHLIMAEGMGEHEKGEETLTIQVEGVTVEGTPDLWDEDTVTDLKSGSIWSAKYDPNGVKAEWIEQLSMYAHILREHGYHIKHGKIIIMYRDWRPSELKKYDWYPKRRMVVKDMELMVLPTIFARVKTWKAAKDLSETELAQKFPCSDDDTWQGRRCEKYCPGAPWCEQYAQAKTTT